MRRDATWKREGGKDQPMILKTRVEVASERQFETAQAIEHEEEHDGRTMPRVEEGKVSSSSLAGEVPSSWLYKLFAAGTTVQEQSVIVS